MCETRGLLSSRLQNLQGDLEREPDADSFARTPTNYRLVSDIATLFGLDLAGLADKMERDAKVSRRYALVLQLVLSLRDQPTIPPIAV